jgi:hypothetical protein
MGRRYSLPVRVYADVHFSGTKLNELSVRVSKTILSLDPSFNTGPPFNNLVLQAQFSSNDLNFFLLNYKDSPKSLFMNFA